jgi:hypothetical protein
MSLLKDHQPYHLSQEMSMVSLLLVVSFVAEDRSTSGEKMSEKKSSHTDLVTIYFLPDH